MSEQPRRRAFRLDAGLRGAERDLEAEIEFHLAMRVQKLLTEGHDPATARAIALQQFGDPRAVRSECLVIDRARARATRRANRLADVRQDVAYALRTTWQHRGVMTVILAILALGIGANTAMFTLVDALLLRALPVPHPEQLLSVGDAARTASLSQGTPTTSLASYPVYADLRDQNRVFSGLYANGRTDRLDVFVDRRGTPGRGSGAEAEHPRGRFVSGNYFSVLQVPASAGRTFTEAEDRAPGADPVVVISDAYAQRRFGGTWAAVGRTLSINGVPFTVIGVTPRYFTGDLVGQRIDIWIPLMMQPVVMPHEPLLTDRTASWLLLMGRLAPGVTIERARSEIRLLERRSLLDHETDDPGGVRRTLRTHPVQVEAGGKGFSYYRGAYAPSLYTLLAAVGLVLLVVCANVANLMLSRAAARGREMSVRMTLGAGRRRLIQQLLTESMLLAVAGGALGLLVAYWGSAALLRVAGGGTDPIPLDVHVNGRILVFTASLSLLTAVLFGLAPALRATRVDLARALRTWGRGVAGSADRATGRIPIGTLLVVAQVALSLLLLVGTGMLVRTTQQLETADIGMARDHLVIARINAARSGYSGPRLTALRRDLLERLAHLPGVAAATLSENGIFSGTESGVSVQVEGYAARADSDTLVTYDDVGPGYFTAIGAHLLRGRDFGASDNETGPRVAVVDETMARFFFPHDDALGHHLSLDSTTFEIVGVVRDVQEQAVRAAPVRRLYVPMAQLRDQPSDFYLEIRTAGDPARSVPSMQRALAGADPTLAVLSVDPLTDLVRDSIRQDRLVAKVVTAFSVLALVLAALGLYGVMAYATVRRTGEFGLRMALGARSGDVVWIVLHDALLVILGGAAIGLPVALVGARLLRGQLFGVGVIDPPSIVLALVVLAAAATVASVVPAWRASRVSPMDALRAE